MNCRVCGIELNDDNRYKSNKLICKKCFIVQVSVYIKTPRGKEVHRNSGKKWSLGEEGKVYYQNYRRTYEQTEQRKQYKKEYHETTSYRESLRRQESKRRELGYIPLNEPFEGSDGHHIDFSNVIYVPKYINKIIPHDVRTGKNMEIINTYAYFFLVQQNIGELNNMFTKEKVI